MNSSGNSGMNKLARTLNDRVISQIESRSDITLDFGSIQSNYSLLTNTFPVPIPKSGYLVCRHLTIGNEGSTLTKTNNATVAGEVHSHTVLVPSKMRKIVPGDRVLVAWVHNDAVVIDVIVSAEGL